VEWIRLCAREMSAERICERTLDCWVDRLERMSVSFADWEVGGKVAGRWLKGVNIEGEREKGFLLGVSYLVFYSWLRSWEAVPRRIYYT
jgi:hypothetical protein